jgi:L-lactate dehydrogenase (cytochrome)
MTDSPSGRRRWPRWAEVKRFVGPSLRFHERDPLARVHTVSDFERLARRRTPRPVFEYASGAAEGEWSLRRSREAFGNVVFHPHVLRDVSTVDASTTILGRRVPMPLVLAPTGFTRMLRTDGEVAVFRAAAKAGIPYTLSTLGTTSIEALAGSAEGDRWFQLYVSRDRGRSNEMIARAREHGYRCLTLTVDVPVTGARLRDLYNGLTIPPTLTLRTLFDMARHPRWLFDALTTEPLAFESLGVADEIPTLFSRVFDPSVTLADIEWLRSVWTGPIVVKGVQRVDDAKDLASAGVDGIAISNHGGRQLDRAVTPLTLLPDAVDAVGDQVEIFLDGGVRSGADVAAAVALGAQAVFIGRPYLFALMAGGQRGVERLLEIFDADYRRTLQLLGVRETADLDRSLVGIGPGLDRRRSQAVRRPEG